MAEMFSISFVFNFLSLRIHLLTQLVISLQHKSKTRVILANPFMRAGWYRALDNIMHQS